jgi:hypothetical protein
MVEQVASLIRMLVNIDDEVLADHHLLRAEREAVPVLGARSQKNDCGRGGSAAGFDDEYGGCRGENGDQTAVCRLERSQNENADTV